MVLVTEVPIFVPMIINTAVLTSKTKNKHNFTHEQQKENVALNAIKQQL